MKILHLIQKNQLRGAETFSVLLAKAQHGVGHEVKIITIFDSSERLLDWDKPIDSLHGNSKFRMMDFAAFKRLNNIIKDYAPDIVQANSGDTLKYAVLSKVIFGWNRPIIFRNASMISSYFKNSLSKALNGWFLKNVDAIASVSQESMKDINTTFPLTAGKSEVIPISINENVKINHISRPKTPIIVHVGGFTFEKNHAGLLRIFQIIHKQHTDWELWLVGSGVLKDDVAELIDDMTLSKNVKLMGHVNNPLDYISAADALVLPSIIEGLPGVILEAFHCGTPVVSYDVGGIKELVINNKTGCLVPVDNETLFAEKVVEVVDGGDYAQLTINAKSLLQSTYSIQKVVKDFDALYKSTFQK